MLRLTSCVNCTCWAAPRRLLTTCYLPLTTYYLLLTAYCCCCCFCFCLVQGGRPLTTYYLYKAGTAFP